MERQKEGGGERERETTPRNVPFAQIPSFLDFSGETGWRWGEGRGGKLVSNSRRGAGSCAGVALWDRRPSASTPDQPPPLWGRFDQYFRGVR